MNLTGHDTIPLLRADGEIIADSERILAYLDDHYPDPAGSVDHRARAREIEQLERKEAASCAAP